MKIINNTVGFFNLVIDGNIFHFIYDKFVKHIDSYIKKAVKTIPKKGFLNFIFVLLFFPIDKILSKTLSPLFRRLLLILAKIGYLKIENKIVLSNFNGNGYGDNPKYICEELISQKIPVSLVWLIKKKKIFNKNYFPKNIKLVRFGTIRAYYHLLTAKVIIKNIRCYEFLDKRKGQFFLQTWHGAVGIKKSGSDINIVERPQSWYEKVYRESSINDLVLSNSSDYSNILKSSYFFNRLEEYPIKELGHPRNDIFFKDSNYIEQLKNKIFNHFNISNNVKIALYAPTYREESVIPKIHFNYDDLAYCFSKRFGGEWKIAVRFHTRTFKKFKKMKFNISRFIIFSGIGRIHLFYTLFYFFSSTESTISCNCTPNVSHIHNRTSVVTFSPLPSLARDEELSPAALRRSVFVISRSIKSFHNLL